LAYLIEKNIIFIHIPKTGGNSIQTAFLENGLGSSWRKISKPGTDGRNQFGIEDAFSLSKHARLSDYQAAVPRDVFEKSKVVFVWRHPFDRLISFNFSPHRAQNSRGQKRWLSVRAFRKMIRKVEPISTFMDLEGPPFPAEIMGLRFDCLPDAIPELCRTLGLDERLEVPHLNRSTPRAPIWAYRLNPLFWLFLWRSAHWNDFRFRPKESIAVLVQPPGS